MTGRNHAFGEGLALPRPRLRLAAKAANALAAAGARLQIQRAWAVFDARAEIGPDVLLGPQAWCFNSGAPNRIRIGSETVCRGLLRCEEFGDGHIRVGGQVYIGDDVLLSAADGITIGHGVLIAHGAQIFDNSSHPLGRAERAHDWKIVRTGALEPRAGIKSAPVVVGDEAWLGFGAIVLPGVTIGEAALVGAGSVVTRDVAPGAAVAGNPARSVR